MPDRARIYAFADLAPVIAARNAIGRAVLTTLGVTGDRHTVTVVDGSGWIDVVADDELWSRNSPAALPTPAVAQANAERFLTALEKAMSPGTPGWPASLQGIAVTPPVAMLARAEMVAVPMRDGSGWNHWLYRAQPTLMLGDAANTRAPVYGASVDVRVGHLGQIVGFGSAWRPLGLDRRTVDLSDYRKPAELGDDAGDDVPPIVYLMLGPGMPQLYLAPYYLAGEGHDLTAVSASSWSLTIDVGRIAQTAETMTLAALARGGSGRYGYRWATIPLDDPEAGLTERGPGATEMIDGVEGKVAASMIEVENGTFVVMVNARDAATGAFAHFQQQVFSSPWPTDDEGFGS